MRAGGAGVAPAALVPLTIFEVAKKGDVSEMSFFAARVMRTASKFFTDNIYSNSHTQMYSCAYIYLHVHSSQCLTK